MRVTSRTNTQHVLHMDDSEAELQFEPADTPLVHRDGANLVVAYLVRDDDCQNPLEWHDGMGKLIGRGRYETRNHSEQEAHEALALDRYGEKNYELVQEEVEQAWSDYIRDEFDQWDEFVRLFGFDGDEDEWREYINKWRDELATTSVDSSDTCYDMVLDADRYIADFNPGLAAMRASSHLLDFDIQAKYEELWQQAYREGRIGDPDAVLLDVYDHSGLHWSIHGGGMQCRWDTSRGAGVWIPDDDCRQLITERAPVYAWAIVRRTPVTLRGKDNKYQLVEVKWNEDGPVHADLNCVAMSDDYSALLKQAEQIAATKGEPTVRQLRWARTWAAEDICQGVLDEYNAWLSGDCWGCVVQEFVNVGTEDEPVWEETDDDACWGHIGSDYAEEVLRSEYFEPRAGKQHEPA